MFKIEFTKSPLLLEKAQALRHRLFFGCPGQDHDHFDKLCEHLIATETKTNKVVGTYRLLLGSVARKHGGFYSETEFDLTEIKNACAGELLELGRSCVDPIYRKYPILALMWKEIIRFIDEKNIRYIFGCASVDKPSPEKIGKIIAYFKNHNLISPINAPPLDGKAFPCKLPEGNVKPEEIKKLLPTLIKGYLRMGARVSATPVWDKQFDTADFFMLLKTSEINTSYRKRFL